MKKMIVSLVAVILICITFNLAHFPGTKAVNELSAVFLGLIYLFLSIRFFREKENRLVNRILGLVLILAAVFSIAPLTIVFINSFTFIVNINYNDIFFNYFKAYLNTLFGIFLFALVSIAHFFLQLKNQTDPAERKKTKRILILLLFFATVILIMIVRRIGFHISFSRPLTKIATLVSLLLIVPYLFYSGLFRKQVFVVFFLSLLLVFFSGLPMRYLFTLDFSRTQWFRYELPVHTVSGASIDTAAALSGFQELGPEFYSISFSGDYSAMLESCNRVCVEESINPGHNCSLFAASGDSLHFLFGRNFDNPVGWKCKTMLCRCYPTNGYASLSLVRMADFGFDISDNMNELSPGKKQKLRDAVFYSPDGINEKGLVVAMASVDERKLNFHPAKPFINCSYLIREMLDHAQNIEEAIAIIRKYNVMNDAWQGSFDQHILIADSTGRSVIAEVNDGEFQFIRNSSPWLVTTNSPSYNVPVAQQKESCPRYKSISENLEAKKGKITVPESFSMLKKVAHEYTEWTAVYDITNREMQVALNFNFDKIYRFGFRDEVKK